MDVSARVCSLLEGKKEKFLQYEQATLAMLDCETDAVEHYITERGKLANEIDELGEEIARVCSEQPDRDLLMRAAAAQIDFEKVPSEYHCIFYGGQAVRSVMSRILESEKQVMERLQDLRAEALSYIRQNQNLPKIKKYLTDLTEQPGGIGLTNGKA